MEKKILYCKKFKFNDLFLKSMLKEEPAKGGFYRAIKVKDGYHINLTVNDVNHQLYLSDLVANDPRYSFEFVDVNSSSILSINLNSFSNCSGFAEWLDESVEASDEQEEAIANLGLMQMKGEVLDVSDEEDEDEEDPDDHIQFEMEDGRFITLEDLLAGIYTDIFFFNPDLGHTMVDSLLDLNEKMSENEYGIDKEKINREDLFKAIESYKNTGSYDDLLLAQLLIIYLMYKEK